MTSRSYGQYCPVARSLELVGERWTLLLVRELLLGPMRFTDLHAALPGIPRNLLADRLRRPEAGSGDAAYRVEVDRRVFALRFVGGGLVIEPPATARPDLTVRASAATLVRLRLGAESVRGAIAAGRLRFDPDDPLRAGRFLDHFALPVH